LKLKSNGPPAFARERFDEYDPDAAFSDKPEIDEAVCEVCEVCGEIKVRAGDGWTCPTCHPDFEQSGELE
jgi:hypothetical protein